MARCTLDVLWAVTSYFPFDDPPGVNRRLAVYREFRRRLQVPLITVELQLEGPFHLTEDDADVLIQLRGGALLFQKERLLNVALRSLPACCDTVAWVDCDIVFQRADWVAAARRLLDRGCMLLQPFQSMHFLPAGALPGEASPAFTANSLGYLWTKGPIPEEICQPSTPHLGVTPGMASVARRETLERHGFYDAMLLGSGDKMMFSAAWNRYEASARAYRLSTCHREHYVSWARRFSETVQGRVSGLDGDVFHLWHGDLAKRFYLDRYDGFGDFHFDPATDIVHTGDSAWHWNSEKPGLRVFIRDYFERRKSAAPHVGRQPGGRRTR